MKACGIPIKTASRCMIVFESIITKLLLVISICSIIYSPTWLPVFINFAFLIFAVFSLACYSFCWKKANNVFVLPILVYETVTIFWMMIWLYASITAVTTGYLWSLEWIGGPQTDRTPTSHDILDERYVNPNETNPETKKAIKYGSIILVVSFVVLILKVLAWSVARRVYGELRIDHIMSMENTKGSHAGCRSVSRNLRTSIQNPPSSCKQASSNGLAREKTICPDEMMELNPMIDTARPVRTPSPRISYI